MKSARGNELERSRASNTMEIALQPCWPVDAKSPDYSHLETLSPESEFRFTPEDLDLLVSSNSFKPKGSYNLIVFGLRGVRLAAGHHSENKESLDLVDTRPNHLTPSCLIGLYDMTSRRLSAYTGSTVPDGREMLRYFKWLRGEGDEAWTNLLPTGCYTYRRSSYGWNTDKEDWEVPVALRLTEPNSEANEGSATVLRASNSLSYETNSLWDMTVPGDAIRPAFSTTTFASSGCLTIRGNIERFSLRASEQWSLFQSRIIRIPKNGRIDLLLLTGAEAHIASRMREDKKAATSSAVRTALYRLRAGSFGAPVRRLQKILGITVDGYFGPKTKWSLVKIQKTVLPVGEADGIYYPVRDRMLG